MKFYYRLDELPDPYQQMFVTGHIPQNEGKQFFPIKHNLLTFGSVVVLLVIPRLVCWPLSFLQVYTHIGIAFSTGEILRGILTIIALLFGVLLPAIAVVFGLRLCLTLYQSLVDSRAASTDRHFFGLFLDDEYLVCRFNRIINGNDCLLIARTDLERAEASNRRGRGPVLDCLLYPKNLPDQPIRLGLKEFVLPENRNLANLINRWRIR